MFLKSLNFKIAALFSGIFILASAILFSVSYLFQYNALVREDVRNLDARTIEFWAVYQTGGAVAVQQALNIETFLTDYDPFLLRIASGTSSALRANSFCIIQRTSSSYRLAPKSTPRSAGAVAPASIRAASVP